MKFLFRNMSKPRFISLFVLGLIVVVCNAKDGENLLQKNQQYSIGTGSKNAEIEILFQTRADGDTETNEDTSPVDDSVATSETSCREGSGADNCCYQYTWLGPLAERDIPTTPLNATCDWYKADRGRNIACFDPIVYTNPSQDATGPPNITELNTLAQVNPNWLFYCVKNAGKLCMRYRFFSNDKERSIINETLFCGSVTETTTNKRIENGCFNEKVDGAVKEICVCNGPRCNGPASTFRLSATLLTIALLSLFLKNPLYQ